jgi:uncharacterized cupin superfamily protein
MALVTRLGAPVGEPSRDDLEGWVRVEGDPRMETWVQHEAKDGTMTAGSWTSTVGTWHATYTAFEFVHLIRGRIVITEDGGEPVTVGPGDAFCVEAGFKGTWRVEEPVLKHWTFRMG